MADAEFPAPGPNKCTDDDGTNLTLNQNTDFEMDQQLPNQEVSFVSGQSKIKTDYLENLLDIPSENFKGNFKDKLGPQLQEAAPQPLNDTADPAVAGTSSKNVEVNYHNQLDKDNILNKIQNVECSVTPSSSTSFSNSATDAVNSENITPGFALNTGNIQQPMQTSHNNRDSSNTSASHQNNQEQMNNSLKLICDYGSDSDIDDIIEIHSKPEDIIIEPSENEKPFLNDYRATQVLFSEDSDDDSNSSDEKSDSDSSTTSGSSSSSSSSSSTSNSSSSVETENASAMRRYVYILYKRDHSKPRE
jgi:hypothetical protein